MTWILTMLLRLPASLKVAGVAVLVLGVVQVRHRLEVRGLQIDKAMLMSEVVAEKSARTDLIQALSEVQADRDTKVLDIERQNESIAAVTVRAERAEAQAALRATRIVQQGQLLADALRRDTGPVRVPPGHAAMNAWLAERLP